MGNINNIKIGNKNLDAIMLSDIHIDPTYYKYNFTEWEVNEEAGHEIEVSFDKVIIKKFKPNVWIMHSKVVNGSQNSAICAYIKGTKMTSKNISKYSDTIFKDEQPLDNNHGAGNDKPKFRGFCPYALTKDYHWVQERSYTWEETWVDADNKTGPKLADYNTFRIGSGGHGTYGIWVDFTNKLMFPDDLYDFNSWGRNPVNNVDWYYGFMLATPIIQNFDDGSWSVSSEAKLNGKVITITKRLESGSANYHAVRGNTLKTCKIKVDGLQDGDRLEYGLSNASVEPSEKSITTNGTHDISSFGDGAGGAAFRLYGDTGVTSEVTIELVNETYPDGIIDVSENPIIIQQVNIKGIDVTTKECWDAYLNNTQSYHKDKTFENCWKKYGFVTDKYTDEEGEEQTYTDGRLSISNNSGYNFDGGISLPNIVDLNDVIKVKDSDGYVTSYLSWNMNTTNKSLWEEVRNWYKSNTINENILLGNLFKDSNIDGDITIKLNNGDNPMKDVNYDNNFLRANDAFYLSKINSITFELAEGHRFSVGQNMFRHADELTECHVNYPIGATDSSGMFEFCGKLKTYDSNLINWGDRANFKFDNKGGTNVCFCFEYTGLETIPQYNQEDRFADDNTIICLPFSAQMFNGSKSLKTVGPVIDVRLVNPSEDGNAKLMFASEAITDIRIKNLNHGDWYLNGKGTSNNYHGNLPNLDQDSINYLIENLYDLPANYQEDNVLSYNNSFSKWNGYEKTIENENVRIDEIGWLSLSECTLGKRFNTGEVAISPCHTTARFTGLKVKVSGLLTGDRLEFGSGVINKTEKSMITDGEYTIDKDNDLDEGFVLYRDNEPLAEAEYQTVLVSIVKPYLYSNPSVKSATLHCPLTWNGKISEDLVQSANTKGWTIVYE